MKKKAAFLALVAIAEADGAFDLNDKRTYKLYKKAEQQTEPTE